MADEAPMVPLTPAQAAMVAENMGLVGHVLRKHYGGWVAVAARRGGEAIITYRDLINEGTIGLCRAVQGWDPAVSRLSTYATLWIRKYVDQLVFCRSGTVTLPSHWARVTLDDPEARALQDAAQHCRSISFPGHEDLVDGATGEEARHPVRQALLARLYRVECSTRQERLGRILLVWAAGLDGGHGDPEDPARMAARAGLSRREARQAIAAFKALTGRRP